jgi:hypothetical protein
MNQLKNSSLSLFAFHLRHSIEQNPEEEVEKNADKIWQNLAALSQPLNIPDLATLPPKLICYKDGKYTPTAETNLGDDEFLNLLDSGKDDDNRFSKITLPGDLVLESIIAAFRIQDTYAAELNLTCSNAIATSQLKEIFIPADCLLPSKIEASLGQTLLLLTEPIEPVKNKQKLAEDCANNLLPNNNLQLRFHGELFGSPIFEYDNGELDPIKSCQVLIWFNTAPKTLNLAIENSDLLLLLLCLYHKIIHAYHQSRQANQKARVLYSQQEADIKSINEFSDRPQETMAKFETLLPKLPVKAFQYARYTRNLEDYLNTIEINTENYQNKLEKLLEDNRVFFRQLLSRANKYQSQIKADLRYLEPGQRLFERAIASIQGIVEIERVKSDRNLQTTVAVVGVGIGFAGVAATASPYWIKQDTDQKLTLIPVHLQPSFGINPPHNLTRSVLFSLGAGLVGVAIAAQVIRYIQKHKKSRIARIVNFILGNSQPQ